MTLKALGMWLISFLSPPFLPSAKADKKAAQVKILQQEHKRQVCVSSRIKKNNRKNDAKATRRPPSAHPRADVSHSQEREGELRAMARKIRMK